MTLTHLLDSDHLSLIQRDASRERTAIVANINLCQGDVGVSVAGFHEQILGCNNAIQQARTPAEVVEGHERLHKVISSHTKFVVVPFDAAAAAKFVRQRAAKVRISTMDLHIACTALVHSLTLVTRNHSDFRHVPSIKLAD